MNAMHTFLLWLILSFSGRDIVRRRNYTRDDGDLMNRVGIFFQILNDGMTAS